jgi:hypothetical protein
VRFCGKKDSVQNIFIKKYFLFTVGSVSRIKRFTAGSRSSLKDEEVEATVKRLLCCGFRRTGKATGQEYQCWWRICREINVFPRFEYHMFYVLYQFVTYLLTLPRARMYV